MERWIRDLDAIEGLDQRWICIDGNSDENHFYLTITDSGSGIPKHLQQKILTPFYTTKEKGKGTGIGLGLCQKFAMHHGGSFYIDTACENTRFVIKLPLK